jgi:hypothetical protein
MLKVDYKLIYDILDEKKQSLLRFGNIYPFGSKLPEDNVKNMVKDIDDFLGNIRLMMENGDVYVEINNMADLPKNKTNGDVSIKELNLLDVSSGTGMCYYSVVAIQCVKTACVDIFNRNVFKQGDNLFYVTSEDASQNKKGVITINKTVFRR